ncbi:hypothetical protein [Hydrogenophaga sp. BPS33]|uniref:hypothetical protein n=1 Tax=Hydrogenophaga sp. BPS33 TaxID=2651974 RepID=UPI00131F9AD8|nr:hypothetical protein [Hydrogenophaga sp. BPS33]QHE86468.1 hypothetical protein F9K07_16950 [Hydrogenophaga sp. BPS33]
MPDPTPTESATLMRLVGRVESRRVLRPAQDGPRMEISFSAALTSGRLGSGSAACSFIGHLEPGGRYQWQGRGALFLSAGTVTTRSWGRGQRQGNTIVYQGAMAFHAHTPSLDWLDGLQASFEYVQDLASLEVTVHCQESPAFHNHLPQQKGISPC